MNKRNKKQLKDMKTNINGIVLNVSKDIIKKWIMKIWQVAFRAERIIIRIVLNVIRRDVISVYLGIFFKIIRV